MPALQPLDLESQSVMYYYGMQNYKTILALPRKLKKTKVLHGIERHEIRVPQCGYITLLITVYLHQNNSDQVYIYMA